MADEYSSQLIFVFFWFVHVHVAVCQQCSAPITLPNRISLMKRSEVYTHTHTYLTSFAASTEERTEVDALEGGGGLG